MPTSHLFLSDASSLTYSSLPIGAVAVAVIIFYLHISRVNNPENLTIKQRIMKLDLIGAAVLVPGIICLLLALQWGGSTYPVRKIR